MVANSYIGRFAPSPTGPLHKGSLLTALASFLDARANNGRWLLRIEDIDPPREIPGAADQILCQLDSHGLHWDDHVLYQSSRLSYYQDALQQLNQKGLLYACNCSRARLRTLGGHYDGACRTHKLNIQSEKQATPHSIRLQIHSQSSVILNDLIQKPTVFDLKEAGDFIVQRRDLLPAYHLATSLDDNFQGITRVIRGNDLLDSTPRQAYLLQCLNLNVPEYGHIPILTNPAGHKLSKQNHAPKLNTDKAAANLITCLSLLGTPAPPDIQQSSISQILHWAIEHWQLSGIPSQTEVIDKTLAPIERNPL